MPVKVWRSAWRMVCTRGSIRRISRASGVHTSTTAWPTWRDCVWRIADYRRWAAPAELLTRAMHSTSDFPQILSELFNKNLTTIRRTPSPIVAIFRQSTVADFRAKHFMEISDGPALEKVNESGEIHFGTISESKIASYKADSYANGFAISFQTLINDDKGLLPTDQT